MAGRFGRNMYSAYRARAFVRPKKRSKIASRVRRTSRQRQVQAMGWHNFTRPSVFPNVKFCTLTYVQTNNLVTSATPFTTGAAQRAFALNGLFDPDVTGTGHQPYLYDEITPLYLRYKVHAVTITLTWLSAEPTEIMIGTSIVLNSQDPWSSITKEAILIEEKRGGDVRRLAPNGEMTYKVMKTIDIKQLEGVGAEFGSETYSALTTANPARLPKIIMAASSGTATEIISLQFNIRLDYHCKFYDRFTVGAS